MICNACLGTSFKQFATRQDGMEIKQCTHCGLGVVASLPLSTEEYYDDNYYLDGGSSGYEDYSFMAEHGLGWVAALVHLLAKHGKILDIGCADGYLLKKFTRDFEKSGIEVNAKAAKQAQDKGIRILGNDLLDAQLMRDHRAEFDIVTSIAVFEHLLDFRGGFKAATELMKDDGFLLFEVPVMSVDGSNAAWMQSSFEHIYYPTEGSIRHIVETELGCQLTGAEIRIKDYASTYIGIATKKPNHAARVKAVFERLMSADFDTLAIEEAKAATHLHLIHAGQATDESVRSLSRFDTKEFVLPLLVRIAQLWTFDLRRLRAAQLSIADLARVMEALEHETSRAAALDGEIANVMEVLKQETSRAAVIDGEIIKLQNMLSFEVGRSRDSDRRTLEIAKQLQAIEQSTAWRVTGPVRRWGIRNPKAIRRARQVAKLSWWTVRGTLLTNVREFMRRRAQVHSVQVTPEEVDTAKKTAVTVNLLPETCVFEAAVDQPSQDDWPVGRPLVSIVIPCFNYGHLVADAIRSAEAQTFSDIEIIVVEGGSTSAGSRQLLEEATAQASPRLKVLRQDKPHRAGANRNFGISYARGKYICCLDADDRLAPTYIEKAVFMLQNSGYDVISPGLQFFGNKSEVWLPHERPTLDRLLDENNALTCAVFPRAFWVKAGGYRDSDRTTGHVHEDWLFWVRLAALGARFICIREPLFYYRSHEGTLSNSDDVLDHEVQKRLVARFNDDVLTPEALTHAREASLSTPPRPPASFAPRRYSRVATRHTMPTLLLAMPFLVLGGAERLLSAVVAHLANKGWRVIIVTTVPVGSAHGDTTAWFEPATVEIFHLPRFLNEEYWRDFLDYLLTSRNIDLLWVIGSSFVYDYLPALRLRHPKLGVADLLFNTIGHTANNRRYADCIDMTFVENREVEKWLLDAGEMSDRISLVQSGVDLNENSPPSNDKSQSELSEISKETVVVGFFGRWSEEKDPLGFVEIARRVPKNIDIVFLMTGAGHLAEKLNESIKNASFQPGRFVLKGSVPDLRPYLQACDILCLPSMLDGRPNVVMEALASATAVIASRVGALPEMIEEGHQGYLCTPGVYDEFASRIVELATNKEKLKNYKLSARVYAECHFDINAMLGKYEHSLAGLVKY